MINMFQRKDHHKKKRLNKGWRKPKGLQNKLRIQKKGHDIKVKTGYMSNSNGKGLYEGLEIVDVANINSLKELDPKKHALNILKISKKNKKELILEAQKQKFNFVNFNAKRYLESLEEELSAQEQAKKQKEEKQKAKQASEKKEKDSKTKKDSSKEVKEETEASEKKEKDKILTKGK